MLMLLVQSDLVYRLPGKLHLSNWILSFCDKTEERKLEAAEKYLEESATMFDEFLKENDKNAVEAIKM